MSPHAIAPPAVRPPRRRRWLLPLGALACLWPGVSPAVALGAGVLFGLAGANARPDRTAAAGRWLLQAAIVALGATMPLAQVARAGLDGIGVTLGSITLTLLLGRWLGRRLGVPADITLLVSGGTAICGGSAIAALAGALRPRAHTVGIALATVFLLNGVALVVFPPIGHAFDLTPRQFGWWAALAIHDTSSVVGAGMAYGSAALAVATTVKLARALWIAPLTLGLALRRRREKDADTTPTAHFPWFIVGFIVVSGAFALAPVLGASTGAFGFAAHRMLVLALFAIGAGFTADALRLVGWRPLLLGVTLWVIVAAASLAAIKLGMAGR